MTGVTVGKVEANGLTFTVRHAGPATGRPVILLHGFPQTSMCFAQTVAVLGRAGYRALAPDQRGYSPGARPAGVEDYALSELCSDVLALADASEIDTFDLVGHDWGGMVGWWVAGLHPDRVRTFTSVSTPHPAALVAALAADADQTQRSSYLDLFRQPDIPERLFLGERGDGEGLRQVFAGSGIDEAAVDPYVEVLAAPGAMTAALNWYRANDLHRADVLELATDPELDTDPELGTDLDRATDLEDVVVPTMYVWSTEDVALGRRAAEATSDHVVGPYRFEVLEGVSHWIPDVAPGPLNQLLLDHLGGY
ncbi:MAG: alpha/beta fold hydrolase [Acidimicrobiales bacterium]